MDDPVLGRRFTAELDMCDLDERLRPGPPWVARSVAISRSRLWLRSRRMCYPESRVATVFHMLVAGPVILVGIVRRCEYDTDSMYSLELELVPPPNRAAIDAILSLAMRGRKGVAA